MTQRHTAQASGTRSLVWLLVLAVVLLSLSVARQQALGSLHQHAEAAVRNAPTMPFTSPVSAAASGLAHNWLSRWQQQQVFGHGQLRVGMRVGVEVITAANPVQWAASAKPDPGHHHAALERHRHSLGDDSLIALDGAAEAADAGNVGAAFVLPLLAAPSLRMVLTSTVASNGTWPIHGAVRFATTLVQPLLRPPAA